MEAEARNVQITQEFSLFQHLKPSYTPRMLVRANPAATSAFKQFGQALMLETANHSSECNTICYGWMPPQSLIRAVTLRAGSALVAIPLIQLSDR